jgi:hypothetical protein
MDTRDLLRARLDTLIKRLEQSLKSVLSAGLNARLHKRIGTSLESRLTSQLTDLRTRRSKITADPIPATVWNAVGNTGQIDRLFDECLTFIQAARMRGPDVSPDLSEITDLLFEELAEKMNGTRWQSYSTFSSEDSYDGGTDIVRLRYPLCDIWDLPVTVHEFGHFMSQRLIGKATPSSSTLPFQQYKTDFLERMRQPQSQAGNGPLPDSKGVDWWTYLDEMFADAFATYALGPAFACTCITLRFDPVNARTEMDGRHPSYSRRAYIIFQTLKRMDNEPGQRSQMKEAIGLLEKRWKQLCEAAGVTDGLPDKEEQAWIGPEVSNIYGILTSSAPELRFAAWKNAVQQQASLLKQPNDAIDNLPIAQLLNTAWILRMTPDRDAEEVNRNCIALCLRKGKQYDAR